MPLELKTFKELTSDMVAQWAAELKLSPSLTSGDPLLAIMHSVAINALWLQSLVYKVNKFARASTAEGEDLDSFMADFGFPRSPAVKAKGEARFSITQARSTNAEIPVGSKIQTVGGAIVYTVLADTTQSHYDPSKGSYQITAGSLYADVTVEAEIAGAAYNVQVGQLKQFSSTVVGVDSVSNLATISNGQDPETDAQYRQRFILWLNSLSKATYNAILSASLNIQTGLDVKLIENKDQNGVARDGYFTVVVDDGSGTPTIDLKQQITDAISPVRGFTIDFVVIGPEVLSPTIAISIKIKSSANEAETILAVQAAIVAYVNALKIGDSLSVYKLIDIAFNNENVIDVQVNSAKVNGSEANLTATEYQVIRTNAINTAVAAY